MNDIGSRIKMVRMQKGINQEDFAKMLGVIPKTVQHYEANNIIPNFSKLEKIAKILNVTVNELTIGQDSKIYLGNAEHNGAITVNCDISDLLELDETMDYIEKIRERTANAVIDINIDINR